VSVAVAKQQRSAATAAAEPPLEPPGTLLKSQGFLVFLKAEVSVEAPMVNSSVFTFPRITLPASFSFATEVASNDGV